jgi:hypothetical protein
MTGFKGKTRVIPRFSHSKIDKYVTIVGVLGVPGSLRLCFDNPLSISPHHAKTKHYRDNTAETRETAV